VSALFVAFKASSAPEHRYHARVVAALAPFLDPPARAWLAAATAAIAQG
jgi:hypothetical protein